MPLKKQEAQCMGANLSQSETVVQDAWPALLETTQVYSPLWEMSLNNSSSVHSVFKIDVAPVSFHQSSGTPSQTKADLKWRGSSNNTCEGDVSAW